ncbi:MAG: flagellar basal body L-ring protein FlgH [Pseudomonadota bacterium]
MKDPQIPRNAVKYLVCLLVLPAGCVVNMGGRDYAPPEIIAPPPSEVVDGAIYQEARDIRLFEDLRAHRVGDILTISLQENTSAQKSASTSTDKSSSASINNPVMFGRNFQRNGKNLLDANLGSNSDFSGEGSSSQSNSLNGDITVTVVERLYNGNLRVRGEKWVTLNQGDEFIRLSGIVRPADINPDNSVASSRVADARITYSSKGILAAANKMGWLQRFVQSVWYPN